MVRTKTNTQKTTQKHLQHHDATDIYYTLKTFIYQLCKVIESDDSIYFLNISNIKVTNRTPCGISRHVLMNETASI